MKKGMLKRVIALLCCMLLVLPCMSAMAEEQRPVTVFVDGKQLDFDVNPIIEYGRTLVPMRFIFEALGAQVTWDQDTLTAFGTKGDTNVAIQIDNTIMFVNGNAIELDVPAMLMDGRTLVPVRAVSESFEAKVEWDNNLRRVTITSNPAETLTPDENEQEPAGNFNIDQLSPADKERLVGAYNSIRYTFEQEFLFGEFNAYAAQVSALIDANQAEMITVVGEIWDNLVMNVIMDIQVNSADVYNFSGAAEDENVLFNAYAKILQETSLDSANIFKTSFEKTPKGNNVLLVSFNSVDSSDPMLIQCKYIGVVSTNGSIRYFTAENSPIAAELSGKDEVIMLCEIKADERASYQTINSDKAAFLSGIDSTLNSK